MPLRNANTQPVKHATRSTLVRTKLDWAIIASLLTMGAFNLLVMADHFGATAAHAATVTCGVPLA